MKKEIFTSMLTTLERDARIVKVCPTVDNRGCMPAVVFSVQKHNSVDLEINFFLSPEVAMELGSALITQARYNQREYAKGKRKDFTEVQG